MDSLSNISAGVQYFGPLFAWPIRFSWRGWNRRVTARKLKSRISLPYWDLH